MPYYEIIMINAHPNADGIHEIHTASRLTSQCNVANLKEFNVEHRFILIGCDSEESLREQLNFYLNSILPPDPKVQYSPCEHCFEGVDFNSLRPIKKDQPYFERLAFKNIITKVIHKSHKMSPECNLIHPTVELQTPHHFHILGYVSAAEERIFVNLQLTDPGSHVCKECDRDPGVHVTSFSGSDTLIPRR